jgi:hypothetical protein
MGAAMEDRSLRGILAIPDRLRKATELRAFADRGCEAPLARACHALARSFDTHARSVTLRRQFCPSRDDSTGSY